MRIYFAGPLFCEAEKDFNLSLANELEKIGHPVFLPQRDGVESHKPPYDAMTKDERRAAMFTLDRDQIFQCDCFLFILDGRVPDEGACVELGLAYSHKLFKKLERRIVGLQTDVRAAFIGGKLNPMLKVPIDELYETRSELLKALSS